MFLRRVLALVLVLSLWPATAVSANVQITNITTATVTQIVSTSGLRVQLDGGRTALVRIHGVNPIIGVPNNNEHARAFLHNSVLGREVRLVPPGGIPQMEGRFNVMMVVLDGENIAERINGDTLSNVQDVLPPRPLLGDLRFAGQLFVNRNGQFLPHFRGDGFDNEPLWFFFDGEFHRFNSALASRTLLYFRSNGHFYPFFPAGGTNFTGNLFYIGDDGTHQNYIPGVTGPVGRVYFWSQGAYHLYVPWFWGQVHFPWMNNWWDTNPESSGSGSSGGYSWHALSETIEPEESGFWPTDSWPALGTWGNDGAWQPGGAWTPDGTWQQGHVSNLWNWDGLHLGGMEQWMGVGYEWMGVGNEPVTWGDTESPWQWWSANNPWYWAGTNNPWQWGGNEEEQHAHPYQWYANMDGILGAGSVPFPWTANDGSGLWDPEAQTPWGDGSPAAWAANDPYHAFGDFGGSNPWRHGFVNYPNLGFIWMPQLYFLDIQGRHMPYFPGITNYIGGDIYILQGTEFVPYNPIFTGPREWEYFHFEENAADLFHNFRDPQWEQHVGGLYYFSHHAGGFLPYFGPPMR